MFNFLKKAIKLTGISVGIFTIACICGYIVMSNDADKHTEIRDAIIATAEGRNKQEVATTEPSSVSETGTNASTAEGLKSIIPDNDIWGVEEDALQEKYQAVYEQCKVGDDEALRVKDIAVGSFNMDVYYVFEGIKSTGGSTKNGLSKIAYIMNASNCDVDLNTCLDILVEQMKKVSGDPDKKNKSTRIWNKKNYKIELGKGKLSKYTGTDETSIGIVFKSVNTSKTGSSQETASGKVYEELSKGSRGEAVIELQNRLNKLGYFVGNADGDYGNKTKTAIEAFQKINGLKVTGVADSKTQQQLFSKKALKPTPTPRPTPTPKPTSKEKDVTVYISADCWDYNHVGNEWSKSFSINGKSVSSGSTLHVKVGDRITCKAVITEQDSYPDKGSGSHTYTVTEKGLKNGFHVTLSIRVKENRGRYSGNTCTWDVQFDFE